MLTLEQAAYKVADNGGDDREVFIDPITIMLICSVLSTIFAALRLWCQWRQGQKVNGAQIKEVCRRPSLRIRRKVHRIVRERAGEEKYAQHGNQLVNAIFQAGANADPVEIESLASQYSYTNQFGEGEVEL